MVSHQHIIDRQVPRVRRRLKAKQQIRLLDFLSRRGAVCTGELASKTGIGNISDTAHKLNLVMGRHGLAVIAERPETPIKNRWGDDSQQHVWRITVLGG